LPLVLVHEDRSRCRPVTEHYAAEDGEAEPDTQRPFSALKALLRDDENQGE